MQLAARPYLSAYTIHDVFSNSFRRASPGSYRLTFLCSDTTVPSEQPVVSLQGKTTILGPAGMSVANFHIVGRALGPGNDRTDCRVLVTHATCARSCFVSSIFSNKALGPEMKNVCCMYDGTLGRPNNLRLLVLLSAKNRKMHACLCHIYVDRVGSEGALTRCLCPSQRPPSICS